MDYFPAGSPRRQPKPSHSKSDGPMQQIHLPTLGARYWAALCLASIFGANMGDLFAHNLGLGHVAGLPYLALALAIVLVSERFDRSVHQVYYWTAIIIVRTAATNFADFAQGDMKLPRELVMAGLTAALVIALFASWQFAWREQSTKDSASDTVLRADSGYWISMFIAGTLGTVIGDYCSHNLHLGDAGASILLSPILGLLFVLAHGGHGPSGGNRGRRLGRKPGHVGTATEHAGDRRDLRRTPDRLEGTGS